MSYPTLGEKIGIACIAITPVLGAVAGAVAAPVLLIGAAGGYLAAFAATAVAAATVRTFVPREPDHPDKGKNKLKLFGQKIWSSFILTAAAEALLAIVIFGTAAKAIDGALVKLSRPKRTPKSDTAAPPAPVENGNFNSASVTPQFTQNAGNTEKVQATAPAKAEVKPTSPTSPK